MSQLPTIYTDRLCIRPFTLNDVDVYHRVLHSSADVMRYLPGGKPRTREQTMTTLQYFIQHGDLWGFSFLALTDKGSGSLLGHVGLHKLSDAVEIGYALGVDSWGRGYATEAGRAMLRFGFEHVGLAEIIAVAYPANTASRQVMQRLEMTYEGETDRYYDTLLVLYRLTRDAYTPSPDAYSLHFAADAHEAHKPRKLG
jgi:RimJ/RimL family protein N-acetyltransferase